MRLSHPVYRPDIDGLRAIAVLAVVGFHAFPSRLKGGFVGVDVFFVISGFLISSIIFENLGNRTFTFAGFYARRIRRIFPSLLLVLVACYAFGWFVLYADEYRQLGKQIAGGAGFISNYLALEGGGYFDNSSDTRPLLHLWSLGIEEQYFIVWPLLLWAAWKRKLNLLHVTVFLALISFLLNMKDTATNATAAFYSPQTRFWELLFGSLAAWLMLYRRASSESKQRRLELWLGDMIYPQAPEADGITRASVRSAMGLLLIAYGVYGITQDAYFPGAWAIVPTLGSVLIISAGPAAWLNRTVLSNRVLVWFGLISYPLYLWHWPLLSFARIIEGELPRRDVRLAAVGVSVVLSWLTYRLLEKPIRSGKSGGSKTIALFASMIAVGGAGYHAYRGNGLKFRSIVERHDLFTNELQWGYRDDPKCNDRFHVSPCQYSNDTLQLMILGDSHGNHLYPGLSRLLGSDVGVISAGTCPPLSGIRLLVLKNQANHPCAKTDFLSGNLTILDSNPGIKTVVVSSFWAPLLDKTYTNARELENWGGIRLESIYADEHGLSNEELVYLGLHRTISELMKRDKDVIIVGDAPYFEKDVRDICLNRFAQTGYSDCFLSKSLFGIGRERERVLFEKLQKDFPKLGFFDPFSVFCDGDNCRLTLDGRPLFRDEHHLSVSGSLTLSKALIEAHVKNRTR